MPHALADLPVRTVVRNASVPGRGAPDSLVTADVCVVGAGIAGISAAVEAARLGKDVVLVDALPVLGGQMVNSLIGLFCGVYGNGPEYRQLTHGLFDEIFRDLGATGDLFERPGEVPDAAVFERVLRRTRVLLIELARAVYVTNDERAAVKRDINTRLGSKIVEEKSYAKY